MPLIAVLAACSSSAPVIEPPQPLTEFAPSVHTRLVWSAGTGSVINRSRLGLAPAAGGDTVYAGDLTGRLSAFDRATGKRRWFVETGLRLTAGPALGPDAIYLTGDEGRIAAFDRRDGKPRWQITASSEVLAAPLALGPLVIVRSVDGRVQAYRSDDASPLWSFSRDVPALSLRGNARPVAIADTVLVGLDDGRLVALDAASGKPRWERTVGQPSGSSEVERLVDVDADPLVVAGDIYAVSYQGRVVRMDRAGRVQWAKEASSVTGLALAGELLVLTDENSEVLAISVATGTAVWRQDKLRGRRLSAPAAQGEYVAVADLDGYVHWLARGDGRLAARRRIDEYAIAAPPVVDGDLLLVQSQGGVLAALRLEPLAE